MSSKSTHSELSSSKRQYDEKEINRVIKRAAELQGKQGGVKNFGLTLVELQQVAADSGIDPRYVRAAVAELSGVSDSYESNFWGGPTSYDSDRIVPGSVDDMVWESIIGAIRKNYKHPGEVHTRGEVREWVYSSESKQAHVSLTPVDEGTHIQFFWSDPLLNAPPYSIALVLSIIMVPVVFESLGLASLYGAALYLVIASLFLFIARTTLTRMIRAERKKADKLISQIELIITQSREMPEREASEAKTSLMENLPNESTSVYTDVNHASREKRIRS